MRIAMDVDGVLADFVGASLFYVESQTGVAVPRASLRTWDIRDAFPKFIRGAVTDVWNARGFCATLKVLPRAQGAISLLREKHDVIFVTTPMATNPWWKDERRLWLRNFFSAGSRDVIFTHNKAGYAKRFDILVDDSFSNVSGFQDRGSPAILVNQPYNRGYQWGLRAADVADAVDIIRQRKKWS